MPKYIDNIDDCNILLFNDIMNGKKEVSGLCVKGKCKMKTARKCWSKIYDEYIETFGLPSDYINYLKTMIRANEFRIEVHVNGKIHKKPLIDIEEAQAKSFIGESSENISILAAKVSKILGFPINLKETSVRQFYGYLKAIQHE